MTGTASPRTFQAAFARENSLQLFINQPIYTGGRLRSAYGITSSSLDASKLELERTRQEIEYRVVETYYAALMNQRGVAVADEQIHRRELQSSKLGVTTKRALPLVAAAGDRDDGVARDTNDAIPSELAQSGRAFDAVECGSCDQRTFE